MSIHLTGFSTAGLLYSLITSTKNPRLIEARKLAERNLKRYCRIRNTIAHKSDFAQRKFEDEVIGSSIL